MTSHSCKEGESPVRERGKGVLCLRFRSFWAAALRGGESGWLTWGQTFPPTSPTAPAVFCRGKQRVKGSGWGREGEKAWALWTAAAATVCVCVSNWIRVFRLGWVKQLRSTSGSPTPPPPFSPRTTPTARLSAPSVLSRQQQQKKSLKILINSHKERENSQL